MSIFDNTGHLEDYQEIYYKNQCFILPIDNEELKKLKVFIEKSELTKQDILFIQDINYFIKEFNGIFNMVCNIHNLKSKKSEYKEDICIFSEEYEIKLRARARDSNIDCCFVYYDMLQDFNIKENKFDNINFFTDIINNNTHYILELLLSLTIPPGNNEIPQIEKYYNRINGGVSEQLMSSETRIYEWILFIINVMENMGMKNEYTYSDKVKIIYLLNYYAFLLLADIIVKNRTRVSQALRIRLSEKFLKFKKYESQNTNIKNYSSNFKVLREGIYNNIRNIIEIIN